MKNPALWISLGALALGLLSVGFSVWLTCAYRRLQASLRREAEKPPTPSAKPQEQKRDTPVGLAETLEKALNRLEEKHDQDLRALVLVLADDTLGGLRQQDGATFNAKRARLLDIYQRSSPELERCALAIERLRPRFEAMVSLPAGPLEVGEATADCGRRLEELAAIATELESKRAVVTSQDDSILRQAGDLRAAFERRQIPLEDFMRQFFPLRRAGQRMTLPDPAGEQQVLAESVQRFSELLLDWLDAVAELRERAWNSQNQLLQEACTQAIAAARPIVRGWQVEIEDVMVGSTRYDHRLHDLAASVPTSAVEPETVIGVHRLGVRRHGRILRKPQVIVAAAGDPRSSS